MEGVDADEDDVVVLVDQLDCFLHLAVHFGADQSAELSDAVVDVDDVVAGRELVQLFQREGELAAPCLVAFKVELVEAVEQLMVREEADAQRLVGETFVYRLVDGGEGEVVSPVLEDRADAGGLLLYVAQYI